MIKPHLLLLSLFSSAFIMHNANAEHRLTIGTKLLAAGWQGNNGFISSSFNSDEGAQLAFSASYQFKKLYTGISVQNGKYNFSGTGPDQFTPANRVSTNNVDVEHQELDLIAGYYFWDRISLFADIKGVSNTWSSNDYKQNFGGLGFGVSGFIPFSDSWTGFGSAGFVGRGDIKDDNKVKVGEGRSGALEIGAIYRIAQNDTLNMGLKFRNYDFEYLDGSTQEYSVNGIFIGYNHSFVM